MTPSESLLWEALRDRRFDGAKFRRQHAVGAYVLDFYCHRARLAVEIDGPVHADPQQAAYDAGRQAILEEAGIRFVRISARLVETNLPAALDRIAAGLDTARQALRTPPPDLPSPAPSREKGRG